MTLYNDNISYNANIPYDGIDTVFDAGGLPDAHKKHRANEQIPEYVRKFYDRQKQKPQLVQIAESSADQLEPLLAEPESPQFKAKPQYIVLPPISDQFADIEKLQDIASMIEAKQLQVVNNADDELLILLASIV